MPNLKPINRLNPDMIFDPGFFADAELFLHPQCSVCSDFAKIKLTLLNGQPFPKFELPKNWRILDGNPICPKHSVIVK